ncbi:hypothetical protein QAD02_019991 [Eretmocerus hayati]|uniref:Uncharacterized protein n=1 Tax=Eretmocerus hayati TaxID=131215 RepID=A0ACC2PNN8_9HYME|nr:hypothetical protein QAD02_019991 [Eretmocerus hayati]
MIRVCLVVVLFPMALMSLAPSANLEFLGKHYKLTESDSGFNDIMVELDIGWFKRIIGNAQYPVVTITKNDSMYTILTDCPFKTNVFEFKLDEVFNQEAIDDCTVKTIITLQEIRHD